MLKWSMNGCLTGRQSLGSVLIKPFNLCGLLLFMSGQTKAEQIDLRDIVSRHGRNDGTSYARETLRSIDASESLHELQVATKMIKKSSSGPSITFLIHIVRRYAHLCEKLNGARATKSLRRLRYAISSLVEDAEMATIRDFTEVLR